jgi:4-diphosphocytidyl-2-C-methyl-D-erythritol kinase
MLYFPNAKINLGLNILKKREDGYHDIASVFYPVGWSDALEVLEADGFNLTFSGLEIPGSLENNLIYRAYNLLQSSFDFKGRALSFHLHKVIPMGAGIGGGSADAGFAIKAINEMLELGLSNKEMEKVAAELGSDCPFFIENRARYCFGRGTSFEDFEINLEKYWILLVYPDLHISTVQAYSSVRPQVPEYELREILRMPINDWKKYLKNDFEEGLFQAFPEIKSIKNRLYSSGALYASMTGSGSTVYGIFENEPELESNLKGYNFYLQQPSID